MKRWTWYAGACLAALALLASDAGAACVLETTGGDTMTMSRGRMRTNWDAGGLIILGKSGKIILLNDKNKIYVNVSPQEFCDGMVEFVKKMMGGTLPPGALDKLKGNAEGSNVTVVDKGDGGMVSGYATHQIAFLVGDDPYQDVFVSTDPKLMAEYGKAGKILAAFSTCMSRMGALTGGALPPEATRAYGDVVASGLVLKTVPHGGGEPEESKVTMKDVPESLFAAPKDYAKVDLETFMKKMM